MTTRHSPLLAQHTSPPPKDSLTLVTGVLGAGANWLLLRFLLSALGQADEDNQRRRWHRQDLGNVGSTGYEIKTGARSNHDDEGEVNRVVVLVSWLYDWNFWKAEARRCVGIDLAQLQQKGRLVFVDGLSQTFFPPAEIPSDPSQPKPSPKKPSHLTLASTALAHLQASILTALQTLQSSFSTKSIQTTLILDHPTLLLHTTSPPITSLDLCTTVLHLRSHVHSTVISLPADEPFLHAATESVHDDGLLKSGHTPLEVENAASTVDLAYQATRVLSCRRLDTGWAEDVSGVLRVTGGGCGGRGQQGGSKKDAEGTEQSEAPFGEWLYYLSADGSVKLWERGAGA